MRKRIIRPIRRLLDVRDGLILDLNMGENVTGDVIDHSGEGNDGAKTGTNIVKDADILKNVLNFDEVDDFISFSNNHLFTTSARVFSCFFKKNSGDTLQNIIGKLSYTITGHISGYGLGLYIYDNVLYAIASNANLEWKQNLFHNIEDNKWYHAVFTLDGWGENTEGKLYINGISVKTHTAVADYHSSYDSIIGAGRVGVTTGKFFKGTISNVRVYTKVLIDEEVKRLYLFTKNQLGL